MQLKTLAVYEVSVYEWDGEETGDCITNDYLCYPDWVEGSEVIDDFLKENNYTLETGEVIQVYEARSGSVSFDKGGKITWFNDIDCATGLNGSPIEEVYG